jgi:hypothetical protein
MPANSPVVMRKARATDSFVARFFEKLLSETIGVRALLT